MKKLLLLSFLLPIIIGQLHAQTWVNVGSPGFLTNPAPAGIAIDTGGTPYVVATSSARVMKFNGSNWGNVGTPVVPWSGAANTSMAINKDGVPYVVYVDFNNNQKATVAKYNGSSWVIVGSTGFTVNPVVNTVIAIDSGGTPYVAYGDYGYSGKVTVMKFNGTSWVTVGSPGFSAGASAYLSLAVNNSGSPYVVYQDAYNGDRATVMTYNGSGWVTVGSPGFSDSSVQWTSIAIDTGGIPYVVFQDAVDLQRATVMRYTGSTWAAVGSSGFSAGGVESTTIAIDKNGTPYVAYVDGGYGLGFTVMEYNGAGWFPLGNPGISPGDLNYVSITLDNNGFPYVLYSGASSCSVAKLDTAMSPITGSENLCVGASGILSQLKSGGTWSSSNTSIVTVNTVGIVTGIAFGEATISYTKGGNSTTFTIFVDSLPLVTMLTSAVDSVCPGDSVFISVSVSASWSSVTQTGKWVSLDASIATISDYPSGAALGRLKGKATGWATLEYIATNNCGSDTTGFSFRIGSCETGVKNITSSSGRFLYLYPNPTTTALTISAPYRVNTIAISNLLGQTVYANEYDAPQIDIDVSILPAGIYLVRVNGSEVRKFVKE